MDKQDIINLFELCRSQSRITDVNQLTALDDLIAHMSDDVDGEYEHMIDIWSKAYRKEEDSRFVKRNLTQLELVELTAAQRSILEVMIQAMSQDNVIRINQSELYEVFGFKNQETLNRNLRKLKDLHYIVQIPFDKLNTYCQVFNRQDGNVYMVNPRLAVKREKSDELYQIYEDLIGKDNADAFNMRVKQQKLYVTDFVTDFITVASVVTKRKE